MNAAQEVEGLREPSTGDASDDTQDSGASSDDADSTADPLPMVVWDERDRVYRCVDCQGEIDGLVCFLCENEHIVPDGRPEYDSTRNDNQAMHEDRVLAPRGGTPLLDVPETDLEDIPLSYNDAGNFIIGYESYPAVNRRAEYVELRRRGASRAMCEEFSLQFTPEKGIVARLNRDLMDEFAGPTIQDGDKWKVYLGRRVQLDSDDHDGTFFIEGILEDALIYWNKNTARWVTLKEEGSDGKTWSILPNPRALNPLALEHKFWYQDIHNKYRYCVVDPDTGLDVEISESEYRSDESGTEEEDGFAVNAYDTDDDEEEEEEGAGDVAMDPTLEVGISFAGAGEDDMEWEGPSYDSDFDFDSEATQDDV
ncbi:hypothetical protein FA13DRAFT_1711793 [Coprinellus micaceus]|uniref:DUF8191 domain-containing protein n=1 Tax=Coprinellus micaceus TaxID=71717 RepID=A0A4Y7T2W6_COPMI|nr:hypothetical protein FA13DRAFT_1711793 [Coprinellus micaceus]